MAPNARPSFTLSETAERVGRFEILLPIGTGGMATVYLARTLVVDELYREVALKLMHPHLRTEDGALAHQLVQEAKVAASIRHPNVVPVLEVADDPHGVYLVMEYVEGATLSALIRAALARKIKIPAGVTGRILADALTGLHAAHELLLPNGQSAELVHRDFSPQNLLVGTDGISRLTDFGIAKVTSHVGVTASGVIKGKVGYMSPEQALGKPLDRRCDVWAAGVVAWELLAQRRLFEMDEQVATLLRIVSEPPPRIRTVRPDVPEPVDEALNWALTTEPSERCPNASAFRDRLLEAWQQFGPLAEPPEVGAFVRKMVGDRLEERRAQINELVTLRGQVSIPIELEDLPPLEPAVEAATLPRPVSTKSEPEATTAVFGSELTTDNSSSWTHTRNDSVWKRSLPGVAAVGLVLVGLGGVAVWRLSVPRDEPLTAAPPIVESSEPATVPLDAAAEEADTGPALRSSLSIRSNAPMIAVRIGNRTVAGIEPTEELDIQLSDEERRTALVIVGRTKDGRRAKADASATATSVDLEFGAARVGGRRPPPKATDKKPPGLAPTPYEKGK